MKSHDLRAKASEMRSRAVKHNIATQPAQLLPEATNNVTNAIAPSLSIGGARLGGTISCQPFTTRVASLNFLEGQKS
jgi:hypothetical protein